MNRQRQLACIRFSCSLPAHACAARYRLALDTLAPPYVHGCRRCPAGARVAEALPVIGPVRRRRVGDAFRALESVRDPSKRVILPYPEAR